MDKEFYKLNIQRLIIHEIFRVGEDKKAPSPRYNSKLTALNEEEMGVLEQRVLQSLSKTSSGIRMEIDDPLHNSNFLTIVDFLKMSHPNNKNSKDSIDSYFINTSKNITKNLSTNLRSSIIPGGIVIVFSGTVGAPSKRFFCIIKAEKHDGFAAEESDKEIVLRLLKDLLLTKDQKLYKIAIYIENYLDEYKQMNSDIKDNFTTYLYDKNASFNSIENAAAYFYNDFLGWKVKKDSIFYTNRFYDISKEFLTNTTLENSQKINLITALHTYLIIDKSDTINTSEFAKKYLPTQIQDAYVRELNFKDVPNRSLVKNTDGISKKLAKRNVKFSSEVSISAPSKDFDDLIQVSQHEDGTTIVKIKGSIIKQ